MTAVDPRGALRSGALRSGALRSRAWAAAAASTRPRGIRRLTALLLGLDALIAAVTVAVVFAIRFGTESVVLGPVDYRVVGVLVAAGWVGCLALKDAYDPRVLGDGTEEYRRVLQASFLAFAVTAITAYSLKVDVSRGVVMATFPVGAAALVAGRWAVRGRVVRARAGGRLTRRTLVVGSRASARDLVRSLRVAPQIGYSVVGVALTSGADRAGTVEGIPAVDGADLVAAARSVRAATVAVTSCPQITPEAVRQLAWDLEGTGIELVVAPTVAEVAAPRVRVQPAAGLTLIHLEEPAFRGARRVLKATLDVAAAAALLAVLSPLLAVAALAVRVDSPGPALFRQRRAGLGGEPFTVLKLRTMHIDAEERLAELLNRNDADGLLFKLREDPRVTRVGRVLRRLSLDELPQLVNVLRRDMSLVGPRPLPVEAAEFRGHAQRRLLVKPGITGLWQVSGRSDLAWDEALRLDLYYVDNWSPGLDALILARTARAVLRGDGAY